MTRCCTQCGRRLREEDGDDIKRRLCRVHYDAYQQERKERRAADQRRRRHGTTAPPIAITPVDAHWLHDAWANLTVAENAVRRLAGTSPEVARLLARLDDLHRELDPHMDAVGDALHARPSAKPRR